LQYSIHPAVLFVVSVVALLTIRAKVAGLVVIGVVVEVRDTQIDCENFPAPLLFPIFHEGIAVMKKAI